MLNPNKCTKTKPKLECGPMPNVIIALPNIGGASVQCRKVWLTPTARVSCSNAAKMQKPLKLERGAPNSPADLSR